MEEFFLPFTDHNFLAPVHDAFFFSKILIFFLQLHANIGHGEIIFVLLNPDMLCFCKQCRSRSVGF